MIRPAQVIAIDGPAASGKSSTAEAVARALQFAHLDSGGLYRGVTLIAVQDCGGRPGAPLDPAAIIAAAERRGLRLAPRGGGFEVRVQEGPVEEEIRSQAVTSLVSAVSALPEVRAWVNRRLRAVAESGAGLVVDGRDIGTVVFPEAVLKVFLTASPRTRAERRLVQRGQEVLPEVLDREAAALAARDAADSTRPVAPLRMAEDAVPLDGTGLSFEQQVERIAALAKERLKE